MIIKDAEGFTKVGALFTIANIGIIVLPWLYRWFSSDTFYIGTTEYAFTSMGSLVCNGIALSLYSIARVPWNTTGRRVALVSLLSMSVFPPLLCILGLAYLIRRNLSRMKPPPNIESRYLYRFYFTYALSILGFGLIITSFVMAGNTVLETFPMNQRPELYHSQMSGIACAVATLLLARSMGMTRMRGAVTISGMGLGLWLVGPIMFCIVCPLLLWFARHFSRYTQTPSRTSHQ